MPKRNQKDWKARNEVVMARPMVNSMENRMRDKSNVRLGATNPIGERKKRPRAQLRNVVWE